MILHLLYVLWKFGFIPAQSDILVPDTCIFCSLLLQVLVTISYKTRSIHKLCSSIPSGIQQQAVKLARKKISC